MVFFGRGASSGSNSAPIPPQFDANRRNDAQFTSVPQFGSYAPMPPHNYQNHAQGPHSAHHQQNMNHNAQASFPVFPPYGHSQGNNQPQQGKVKNPENSFIKRNPFSNEQSSSNDFCRFKVKFSDGNIRAVLVDFSFLSSNPFDNTIAMITRLFELHFNKKPVFLSIRFKDNEGDECIFDHYSFSLLNRTSNFFIVEEVDEKEMEEGGDNIQSSIIPVPKSPESDVRAEPAQHSVPQMAPEFDQYADSVRQLVGMGFPNVDANRNALIAGGNDLNTAVGILLQRES